MKYCTTLALQIIAKVIHNGTILFYVFYQCAFIHIV